MEILHSCCCGLDVHKQSITASVVWKESRTQRKVEKRVFGTMTRDLIALRDWLRDCGVTHVAMESTGVYWKPVWNVLEPDFDLLLANAQHVKALPGQKTDQKDSEWIADLLQHGLLKKSFVPPLQIRELRDLTRYRICLAEECNRVANRIQKVLEDANIKLASVASDVLGASGRAMLKIIISGDFSIDATAELARGRLRNKIPELQLALEGKVTEHHRFLLRELLDHLEFLEAKILHLEQEIAARTQRLGDAVVRLCTIPGVSHITAWGLIAEIGADMSRFPTAQHLASWAGLCPGQHESAGKRKNTRTRKGSVWLRRCLCQCAWAVSKKKTTYLSALYRRLAARRGGKRAVVGVAHAILVIAYHLLARQVEYRDLGATYFDQINPERSKKRLLKRLERMGYKVTLQPVPVG